MVRVKNEIVWLLGGLLGIGLAASWLHSGQVLTHTDVKKVAQKSIEPFAMPGKPNPSAKELDAMSPATFASYLQPLIMSGSLNNIIELVKFLSPEKVMPVVNLVLEDTGNSLSAEQKLHMVALFAKQYAYNQQVQQGLFEAVLKQAFFGSKEPFLALWARLDFASIVPDFLAWDALANHKNITGLKAPVGKGQEHLSRALTYIAQHDDKNTLEKLHNAGIKISKSLATQLLFEVAQSTKGGQLVPYLVSLGADLQAVDSKNFTPLMHAVKGDNVSVLQKLIDAGADLNFMKDVAVGSALQIAILERKAASEKLLRASGARE